MTQHKHCGVTGPGSRTRPTPCIVGARWRAVGVRAYAARVCVRAHRPARKRDRAMHAGALGAMQQKVKGLVAEPALLSSRLMLEEIKCEDEAHVVTDLQQQANHLRA